jgi:hypothetical protein
MTPPFDKLGEHLGTSYATGGAYVEQDFPTPEQQGAYHGADEVPAGHPDRLDYMGFDEYGGQPCPHNPHWRHCAVCNPEGER